MGYLHGFSESDFYGDEVNTLQSSIPAPPSDFRLREDQLSGSSMKGVVAASLVSVYKSLDWEQEGGDPCLPVPWSWMECNSDSQRKIISVKLSSLTKFMIMVHFEHH